MPQRDPGSIIIEFMAAGFAGNSLQDQLFHFIIRSTFAHGVTQ